MTPAMELERTLECIVLISSVHLFGKDLSATKWYRAKERRADSSSRARLDSVAAVRSGANLAAGILAVG